MHSDNKNRFDDMLRNKLNGTPSQLPDDMLNRILDKNKRKKRLMFWWLNFAVGIYALVLVVHLGSGGWTQTAFTKADKIPGVQGQKKEPLRAANGANNSTENAADISNQSTENGAGESEYLNPKPAKSNTHIAAGGGTKSGISVRRNYVSSGSLAWGSEEDGAADVADKSPENPEPNAGSTGTETEPNTPVPDIDPTPIQVPVVEENPEIIVEENPEDKSEAVVANNTDEKDTTLDPPKPKVGLQLVFGVGMANERQSLGLKEHDERYVHRDLGSVLESAPRPATGAEFAIGLKAFLTEKFAVQAGVQYMGLNNHLHVDYFVEAVPVVDTNGMIKGYIELQDSFKQRIVIDRKFKTSVISVPLEFSYMQHFGKDYAVSLGLGIRPQLHLVENWALPQNIQLVQFRWVEMKQLFSAPTTLSMGLYRTKDNFTLGLNGRINPKATNARDLSQNITFQSRQLEFGVVCLYRINNKKEK